MSVTTTPIYSAKQDAISYLQQVVAQSINYYEQQIAPDMNEEDKELYERKIMAIQEWSKQMLCPIINSNEALFIQHRTSLN